MPPDVITQILDAYGVAHTRVRAAEKGYRNESHPVELTEGGQVNVLLYKSEPGILSRIQNANSVANFLHQQSYPARSQYDPRVLQLKAGPYVKYGCLYHYLPGATIPWQAYTKERIKALGAAMSDMHALLKPFDGAGLPHVADEYTALLQRMDAYFAEAGVQEALQRKLGLRLDNRVFLGTAQLLQACGTLPGAQPLHMDFVRGNILFDDQAHITGVLDFEKTALGHPAFDIARTYAFLLVDRKYKPADKVRKYFLYSGYQKRGRAPLPPVKLIDALVPLFLLHDFYKFLRHNPYESLGENEHYVRTERLLKQLKMCYNI